MCWCRPEIRTPECDRPNCHPPGKPKAMPPTTPDEVTALVARLAAERMNTTEWALRMFKVSEVPQAVDVPAVIRRADAALAEAIAALTAAHRALAEKDARIALLSGKTTADDMAFASMNHVAVEAEMKAERLEDVLAHAESALATARKERDEARADNRRLVDDWRRMEVMLRDMRFSVENSLTDAHGYAKTHVPADCSDLPSTNKILACGVAVSLESHADQAGETR